jgi:DHA1 family multidrug resistance protein-like MFS transporter
MLFGLAFIVGPLFGAFLLNFGIKAIFYFMVVLSFLEILLILFKLKETVPEKTNKKIQINPFKSIFKYFLNPKVRYWLISFFIVIFAGSIYQVMLPIFLNKKF